MDSNKRKKLYLLQRQNFSFLIKLLVLGEKGQHLHQCFLSTVQADPCLFLTIAPRRKPAV